MGWQLKVPRSVSSFDMAAIVALWIVALFHVSVSLGLRWEIHDVLTNRQLRSGAPAPEFSVIEQRLQRRVVASFGDGDLSLLIFVRCDSSGLAIATQLAALRFERPIRLIVISLGDHELCHRLFSAVPNHWILGYDQGLIADAYGVMRFPTAVLIKDRRIACPYVYPLSMRRVKRLSSMSVSGPLDG